MPDFSSAIIKTTVLPLSGRSSRIEMTLADNPDPEKAIETVSFSVVVDHGPAPLFAELQRAALQRVRNALSAQTQDFAQFLSQVRP